MDGAEKAMVALIGVLATAVAGLVWALKVAMRRKPDVSVKAFKEIVDVVLAGQKEVKDALAYIKRSLDRRDDREGFTRRDF